MASHRTHGNAIADDALNRLLEGNRRFACGAAVHPNDTRERRIQVASTPRPFAMILGCADSRVPPELVFDCGLGDLFVLRTGAQAIDHTVLASLEFGVTEMHIPFLMVLGHERCRAVEAAIGSLARNSFADAHMHTLVKSLRPAVQQAKGQSGDLLRNAVRAHVELTVNRLKNSLLLAEAVDSGKLTIAGACYALETGVVEITVQPHCKMERPKCLNWIGVSMNQKETNELKERIAQFPDERLLTMVTTEVGDYRPEAIDYAKAELSARGIDIAQTSADGVEPGTDDATAALDSHGSNTPVCLNCGGPMRPGTLVAEKEITIIFTDNREERFVRVNACTQCAQLSLAVDYENSVLSG